MHSACRADFPVPVTSPPGQTEGARQPPVFPESTHRRSLQGEAGEQKTAHGHWGLGSPDLRAAGAEGGPSLDAEELATLARAPLRALRVSRLVWRGALTTS